MYVNPPALRRAITKTEANVDGTAPTRNFRRRGGRAGGARTTASGHTTTSAYATEMLSHLPTGATKDLMLTSSSSIYDFKKTCERMADCVEREGTRGSMRAAHELRNGEKKPHLALAEDPDRNPYITANPYTTTGGGAMTPSEKKAAPTYLNLSASDVEKVGKAGEMIFAAAIKGEVNDELEYAKQRQKAFTYL